MVSVSQESSGFQMSCRSRDILDILDRSRQSREFSRVLGCPWVGHNDLYQAILAGSRQISRDHRHSQSFSPFSSGLGSSRRVSIILSLVSWSRVHHWLQNPRH
jgi:hypothetical protein